MKNLLLSKLKLICISFILGGIICLTTYIKATTYNGKDISYDNDKVSASNVQDAIDDINGKLEVIRYGD